MKGVKVPNRALQEEFRDVKENAINKTMGMREMERLWRHAFYLHRPHRY